MLECLLCGNAACRVVDEDLLQKIQEVLQERVRGRNDILRSITLVVISKIVGQGETYVESLHCLDKSLRCSRGVRSRIIELQPLEIPETTG